MNRPRAIAACALLLLGPPPAAGKEEAAGEAPSVIPVDVRPEALAALLRLVDRVVVVDRRRGELFSSRDPKDLRELAEALTVVEPERWFHCMCIGDPLLRLYRGAEVLATITNHHGLSVRTPLWSSDAELRDPERWARWLAARGAPDPLQELERGAAEARKYREVEERWFAAVPAPLRPFFEARSPHTGRYRPRLSHSPEGYIPDSGQLEPLRAALALEWASPARRIRALLSWYGSGAGPWSGSPIHELIPELLLLDYPGFEVVAALGEAELSEAEAEGAARLLGGWTLSAAGKADLASVPPALRRRLLEHALRSGDAHKIARAGEAFGKGEP